jgi:hypothetical protein
MTLLKGHNRGLSLKMLTVVIVVGNHVTI